MEPTEREDHAAYVASWLRALRDDKRAIVRAANAAQAASELILSHMAALAMSRASLPAPPPSPFPKDRAMLKTPPKIELSWRDENYGSVYAVTAFRNYAGTLDWSDRTHQRFRGYLKRAGFEFHYGRCRSEGSRVGKEWGRTCRSRWSREQ